MKRNYISTTTAMDAALLFNLIFAICGPLVSGQFDVQYQISEELSDRTFGNIVADLSLGNDYTPNELSRFSYRFLSSPNIAVEIDGTNGDLKIVGRIDREQICPKAITCSTQLDIVISMDINFLTQKKINIDITDINDNIPSFNPEVYHLEIPESASVGISFTGLPTAVDLDSPNYSIKEYLLRQQSDTFAFQSIKTANDLYDLKLILLQNLDRELQDSYTLNIDASDGSDVMGNLTVEIVVKDSNDNPPVFNSSSGYQTSINENIDIGTTILHVYASDADIGNNGQVVYKFRSSTQDAFAIDNTTGAIYTKGIINYEDTSIYHLVVMAQDRGSDSIPVDAHVTINVIDRNDNIPEITINTRTASNTNAAQIPEDVEVGTFVAQLLVSDADSNDNGKVTCRLNDNIFRLEEVVMYTEYKIVTEANLNRETRMLYNLAIICHDQGLQSQTTIKQLRVDILDSNDHAPIFIKPSYYTEIYENNAIGAPILTVNATDQDTGANAQITYSLSIEAKNQFTINPINGAITATISLDREVMEQARFFATATDNGQPRLSSSVFISVTLKDVNDEIPQFDELLYIFHLEEESLAYTSIGSIYAMDPDSPPDNAVYYTINDEYRNIFNVNPQTGEIKSLVVLDREQQTVYNLVITATDSGNPAQSSTTNVDIILDDINDNEPIFVFPTETNHTLQISNTLPVGTRIAQIFAFDHDSGTYGQVTYDMNESVDAGDFSLEPLSGDLTLIADLSLIEIKEYELVILASDQDNPPKIRYENLKIIVNNSISIYDDQYPILSKPNETAVIALACIAGIIIVPLVIGIACICHHRNQLRTDKKQRLLRKLTFLSFGHHNKDQISVDSKDPNRVVNPSNFGGVVTMDTDHMVHQKGEDKMIQRASSVQDSGIDNPGVLNISWNSLNASQLQDERDTSSAEVSNADSGRGPSEAEDNQSHLHIVNQKPSGGGGGSGRHYNNHTNINFSHEQPPERPPRLPKTAQFDSPGRRILYNTNSVAGGGDSSNHKPMYSPNSDSHSVSNPHTTHHQHQHNKQDCTRPHHLSSRSFNSHTPFVIQQTGSNKSDFHRGQHIHHSNEVSSSSSSPSSRNPVFQVENNSSNANDLHRSDSYPDRPIQYVSGQYV